MQTIGNYGPAPLLKRLDIEHEWNDEEWMKKRMKK